MAEMMMNMPTEMQQKCKKMMTSCLKGMNETK
jgi:hypothetical protein